MLELFRVDFLLWLCVNEDLEFVLGEVFYECCFELLSFGKVNVFVFDVLKEKEFMFLLCVEGCFFFIGMLVLKVKLMLIYCFKLMFL